MDVMRSAIVSRLSGRTKEGAMSNGGNGVGSYRCAGCKRDYSGAPVLTNGAGSFCERCREDMVERLRAVTRDKVQQRRADPHCLWCGVETEAPPDNATDSYRVCAVCQKNRDWLLGCIRYSPRAAMYAKEREGVEGPKRDERERLAAEAEEAKKKAEVALPDPQSPVVRSEIDDLKAMLRAQNALIEEVARKNDRVLNALDAREKGW